MVRCQYDYVDKKIFFVLYNNIGATFSLKKVLRVCMYAMYLLLTSKRKGRRKKHKKPYSMRRKKNT